MTKRSRLKRSSDGKIFGVKDVGLDKNAKPPTLRSTGVQA